MVVAMGVGLDEVDYSHPQTSENILRQRKRIGHQRKEVSGDKTIISNDI